MKARAEVLNRILESREADITIEYQRVWRNNVEKEAYVLRGEMGYATPVMYRGAWLEKSNEEVVDFLIKAYNEYAMMVDIQGFTDRENAMKKIMPRISAAANREMMANADICYLENVEGLLTSFYLPVTLANEEEGYTQLTNALLAALSITLEEAYAAALKNMSASIRITTVEELLAEMLEVKLDDDPADPPALTVVTAQEKQPYGAAAILLPELANILTARLGCNEDEILIIPSSVHEILATPTDKDADLSAFTDMVREVNDTQVAPEDRLSYNVYGWRNGVLQALA